MPPLYLNSDGFGLAGLWIGGALIGQRDEQSLVQERQFAQTLRQGVEVVFGDGENTLVGQEVNFGSELLGRARFLQLAGRLAFGIGLLPGKTVAPDLEFQFFAERVHAGNANAVQSAGDFVGRGVELAAGVQLGHDHLRGRKLLTVNVHRVHGNAAAVVHDGDGVIDVDGDFDLVGVTGERLVHRVVHYLVDQVMQSHLAGRADVHRGAFANGFHAAEHFDGVGSVVSCR